MKQNIQFHSFRGLRLEFIFIFGHALLTFAIQYSRNNSTFLRGVQSRLKGSVTDPVIALEVLTFFSNRFGS